MNLKQFLADKKQTSFEFARVEMTVAESNGDKIAILHLKQPIESVTGSQVITLDGADATRLESYDVETVRVHQDDFEDSGITVNDDGSGSVASDLRLDVSRSGDVWLKSVSFAAFGQQKRRENSNNRSSGIVAKMLERKTTAKLKNTDVDAAAGGTKPEPVETKTA